MAAYAASKRPPHALILESGFPDARTFVRRSPVLRVLSIFSSYRFPTTEYLDQVAAPVLVMHGDDDRVVPFAAGQSLYESIKGPKKWFTIAGADHNDAVPPDAASVLGARRPLHRTTCRAANRCRQPMSTVPFSAVRSSHHRSAARASMPTQPSQPFDQAAIMGALYGDGIAGLKAAFDRDCADRMHEDVRTLYAEASAIPGGAIGRGPERYYVEVHPERIGGFLALATHPWVVAVCEAVLGPEYTIVEIGFRYPVSRRGLSAVAPRLSVPGGNADGPPAELARVQPDNGRRDAGDGAVRGGGRDAVGSTRRFRARDVSAQVNLPALRVAGTAEACSTWRHLGAVGAHEPSRNAEPFAARAAGPGAWCGRARCSQR